MARRSLAAGGAYQVLVIPLFTEGRRRDHVDRVLLVDVPEERQVERLMQRDGVTREQAQASLAAQATRAERLAVADDVVRNDGRVEDLRDAVAALHARYLQLAAQRGGTPVVPKTGDGAE
jgi:dephospho-CoA kinase